MPKEILPHFTRNTALAVTAFMLRIPVTRRRVYTEEYLAAHRMTAKQAHATGLLGDVYYAIHVDQSPQNVSGVVEAFNEEKLAIEEGRATTEIDVDPRMVARIVCRALFARKNFFADLYNKCVPFLRVRHVGDPQRMETKDGGWTLTVPGFKDIRVDADEATKQHLA